MMNVDEFTLKCLANRMQLAKIHAKNGNATATEHDDMMDRSERIIDLVQRMLEPLDKCTTAYPVDLRDAFHSFGKCAMRYFQRQDEIAQNELETQREEEQEEEQENSD